MPPVSEHWLLFSWVKSTERFVSHLHAVNLHSSLLFRLWAQLDFLWDGFVKWQMNNFWPQCTRTSAGSAPPFCFSGNRSCAQPVYCCPGAGQPPWTFERGPCQACAALTVNWSPLVAPHLWTMLPMSNFYSIQAVASKNALFGKLMQCAHEVSIDPLSCCLHCLKVSWAMLVFSGNWSM